jgi:PKHD-type hydroxylase
MKYLWMTLDNVLTNEQCDELIQIAHTQGFKHAALGNDEEIGLKQSGYIDEDIRKAQIALIPYKQLSWLQESVTEALRYCNQQFRFDLDGFMDLQVIKYEVDSFFLAHLDILTINSDMQRKVTFVIQLSNPDDYVGGDLCVWTKKEEDRMSRKKGSLHAFPSYLLHEVTPTLSGTRYSLIGWCFGPEFK